jgi:polar amino acid transport system substrate-binding protein
MVWSRWCLYAALLLPAPAHALKLRLCVDARPHPPFLTPDGGGSVGALVRLAAAEAGVQLELYHAPVTRCREEIRANLADGYPSASYTPTWQTLLDYPMKKGRPDPARAVLFVRVLAYQRSGGNVGWDGKHFSRLSTPVLVSYGSVMIGDRLGAIQQPSDTTGKNLAVNFTKLAAGRGDVALGWENDGLALLDKPEFAGKVEPLAPPFAEEMFYLGLSKRFVLANPAAAEQLWAAIGRIKNSQAALDAAKSR